MTRAFQRIALVAGLLGVACAALGLAVAAGQTRALATADPATARDAWTWAHAGLGVATAVAGCLAAAVALLLGLQGLLEPGRSRLGPALLATLGPAVTALAVYCFVTGHDDWRLFQGEMLVQRHEAFVRTHGWKAGGLMTAALGLLALVAWLAARRPADED